MGVMGRNAIPPVLQFAATAVCLACGGSDKVTGPPPPHTSQIEVRYTSALTATQQNAVAEAVNKWTRALSKDLGDFKFNTPANQCFPGEPSLNETHHNLLLFISVGEVDGPGHVLAFTEICGMSSRDTLPVMSHINLDRADLDSLEARGELSNVITHEIGHALGFNPQSYTTRGLAGGGTNDPFFQGGSARAEFAKHGAWYTGATVPLEDRSGIGPNDPHWRLLVFGDELMVTGLIRDYKSPLSTITLGFFKDIGYDVDFSVADSYEVVPLFGGDRLVPDGSLRNDFVTRAPPTFVSPLPVY
jgi:hypothetical protein